MRHETMYPRPSDEETKAPGVSSDGHEELAMCGAQEHSGIVRCIDGGRESIIGFHSPQGPRLQVRMQGPCSLHFHSVVVIRVQWRRSVDIHRRRKEGRKEGSWHWAAEALIG
ncbi:hypothetical protein NEUTE2DRAFT_123230 [Neurospora tetrasperma FGSC 2509]|nr:hypothetical protein NEUTE2DRAFT_123230 [Neurospora tetrasperma FGSC 2509]